MHRREGEICVAIYKRFNGSNAAQASGIECVNAVNEVEIGFVIAMWV